MGLKARIKSIRQNETADDKKILRPMQDRDFLHVSFYILYSTD